MAPRLCQIKHFGLSLRKKIGQHQDITTLSFYYWR